VRFLKGCADLGPRGQGGWGIESEMRAPHGVAARAVRAPSHNKRGEKAERSQSNHAKFEDGEVEAHEDGMLGEDYEAEALGSKASLRHVSPPSSGGDDLAARIRDAARGENVGFPLGPHSPPHTVCASPGPSCWLFFITISLTRGMQGKSPRDRTSSSDQDTSRASLYKQGSIHFKNNAGAEISLPNQFCSEKFGTHTPDPPVAANGSAI
jgi:hypothetical protein